MSYFVIRLLRWADETITPSARYLIDCEVIFMARGKKLSPQQVYDIMSSWAVTNNLLETSRELGYAVSTVETIVKRNKDKDEYISLVKQKRADFSARADKIIDKGLRLLDRQLSRAIDREDEIDELIDEVYNADEDVLSDRDKNETARRLSRLKLEDIKALTTAIGTLYDKKALSDGKATSNTEVTFKLPKGFDEYAK